MVDNILQGINSADKNELKSSADENPGKNNLEL